jgi:hypothetical protein
VSGRGGVRDAPLKPPGTRPASPPMRAWNTRLGWLWTQKPQAVATAAGALARSRSRRAARMRRSRRYAVGRQGPSRGERRGSGGCGTAGDAGEAAGPRPPRNGRRESAGAGDARRFAARAGAGSRGRPSGHELGEERRPGGSRARSAACPCVQAEAGVEAGQLAARSGIVDDRRREARAGARGRRPATSSAISRMRSRRDRRCGTRSPPPCGSPSCSSSGPTTAIEPGPGVVLRSAVKEGFAAVEDRGDGVGFVSVARVGVTAKRGAQAVEAAIGRHAPESGDVAGEGRVEGQRRGWTGSWR